MVVNIIPHILAKISLKKMGIESSTIGWFWIMQILLTVIMVRFIDKAIDFVKDLITGHWSYGQVFEGLTGILAIVGVVIVGTILLLVYTGKIKTENHTTNNDFQNIEILSDNHPSINSLIRGAKEEVNIIYSPLSHFIDDDIENIFEYSHDYTIDKIRILVQNPNSIALLIKSYEDLNNLPSLSKYKKQNNIDYNENYIHIYTKLISEFKSAIENSSKLTNIEFRMIDIPFIQSAIFIDPPNNLNDSQKISELYILPFICSFSQERNKHPIVYRIKRNSRSTDNRKSIRTNDLIKVEYTNFLKVWESATPYNSIDKF
ncbi:MAG: hypothetical protein ACTHJ2_05860 [Candidatus Nitrosocosmicus sp.]